MYFGIFPDCPAEGDRHPNKPVPNLLPYNTTHHTHNHNTLYNAPPLRSNKSWLQTCHGFHQRDKTPLCHILREYSARIKRLRKLIYIWLHLTLTFITALTIEHSLCSQHGMNCFTVILALDMSLSVERVNKGIVVQGGNCGTCVISNEPPPSFLSAPCSRGNPLVCPRTV